MLNNRKKSTSDVLKQLQGIISMQKVIIFMLLAFIAVLVCTVIYVSLLPKTVPWVVELSADGESTYVGDATAVLKNWSPSDSTTRYFLSHYIKAMREVSTDNTVNKTNATDVYSKSLESASNYVDNWYKTDNPVERSKSVYVTVPIEELAVVAYAANQWKVTWRETEYRRSDRSILRDEQWEAVLTVKYYIPDTERRQRENPIGLYVTNIVTDRPRSLM